jgi:Na+-transporting NADH:ubiquinone oxidoreductase subunit NqrF
MRIIILIVLGLLLVGSILLFHSNSDEGITITIPDEAKITFPSGKVLTGTLVDNELIIKSSEEEIINGN